MKNYLSASEAQDVLSRFLALLSDEEIDVPNQSGVEKELLEAFQLREQDLRNQGEEDHWRRLELSSGVIDLAAKLLSCADYPEFERLKVHLRELLEDWKPWSKLGQVGKQETPDNVGRKSTELYLASVLLHCIDRDAEFDLETKDTERHDGAHPDIIIEYCGRSVGIAVKSVSSRQPRTLYDRIVDGVRQLDNSDIEQGIIAINLKDRIDHSSLLRAGGGYSSTGEAVKAMRRMMLPVIDELVLETGKVRAADTQNDVSFPPLLFICQSLVKVQCDDGVERATVLKVVIANGFENEGDQSILQLAFCLNHHIQTVLRGKPGPPPS